MAQKRKRDNKRKRSDRGGRRKPRNPMPFDNGNYVLIVVGLVIVGIGYGIMAAENEVDGFLSLYVSPIVLLVGYLEIIYAIIWRKKAPEAETN